ncbi:unnamed protein product [Eruca vesicaria subsp. sativa]|uniref:KIB1-4 beta-propeller domain-containing protein n=1 Tax=Eruca vesicaria subsp. sativa TaxID=29727 RepID=A0ABC8LVH7_ERUVS|nr:unnamed protein product [Eruca vesicaria subsp. sativa]
MSLFLISRSLRRRSSTSVYLPLLLSKGFSTTKSLRQKQTPPCSILGASDTNDDDVWRLQVAYSNKLKIIPLEKKIPLELVYKEHDDGKTETIGASHGWIATVKEDGILRLQDDFNPVASDANPKRIPLPPLVTLAHCQTKIITNVSMSSSCPEDDEDCVVAVKFLGPQLSFCKPASKRREWTNVKIQHPCFFSSRVVYSEKDNMFRIPGSRGKLIGSWDPCNPSDDPKLHKVERYTNFPRIPITTPVRPPPKDVDVDPGITILHLVESRPTGETFLVTQHKIRAKNKQGVAILKTSILLVCKLDDQGNAVYVRDMGDLVIFLSRSEPFCVPASSFPGMRPNELHLYDDDDMIFVDVDDLPFNYIFTISGPHLVPYQIPPQDIK